MWASLFPVGGVVAFTPDILSNLTFWLDASDASTLTVVDDVGTDRVTSWRSKAGATRDMQPPAAINRPERITDGVRFDGVDDFIELLESSGLDWTDGTLVVVYKSNDTSVSPHIFNVSSGSSDRLRSGVNLFENPTLFIASATGDALPFLSTTSTNLQTIVMDWEGGVSATIRDRNGNTSTDSSFGLPSLDYDKITVGQRPTGVRFSGDIFEIILYSDRKTSIDIDRILQYTLDKWGN